MGSALREGETYSVKDELNDRYKLVSLRRDADIVTNSEILACMNESSDNTAVADCLYNRDVAKTMDSCQISEALEDTDNEYHDIDSGDIVISEQNSECGDIAEETDDLLGDPQVDRGQGGSDVDTQDRLK